MFSPVTVKAAALGAMKFVLTLGGKFLKHQKADSLIRFTKSTRVEPIALVDQRISHLPFMPDIMQSLSSIFTGYYLQAVSLAVNVGRVNVIKLLDALNPTRDVSDAAAAAIVDNISSNEAHMLSLESYRYQLPVPGQAVGLENFGDHLDDIHRDRRARKKAYKRLGADVLTAVKNSETGKAAVDDAKEYLEKSKLYHGSDKSKVEFGKDTIRAVHEAVNLSVGKLVEVTVSDDGKSATFPIAIRLISTIVSAPILVHILGDGSRNVSAKERYHAWRSGQIEFIRDLVLCQDLIDEHRAALMKDKSGVYGQILARRAGNSTAAMLTQTPSIGTASNLVVLSKQTVKELEQQIGGRLSDAKTRDKIFKNTYIMIMVVVDPDWEQVTFYHRGIATPTQLSIRELKTANKSTGPDIAEILKAYQLGQNPTI